METIIVAALAGLASILVAVISSRAAVKQQVQQQVVKVQKDNHLLYMWNRQLVDHIYRQQPPPPPAPPKGLFE